MVLLMQVLIICLQPSKTALWLMSTALRTDCILLAALDCKARVHLARPTWRPSCIACSHSLSMATSSHNQGISPSHSHGNRFSGFNNVSHLAILDSTLGHWMTHTRDLTLDIACNHTCLSPKAAVMHATIAHSRLCLFYHILVCLDAQPFLTYTHHSMSLISSSQLLAHTISIYFGPISITFIIPYYRQSQDICLLYLGFPGVPRFYNVSSF